MITWTTQLNLLGNVQLQVKLGIGHVRVGRLTHDIELHGWPLVKMGRCFKVCESKLCTTRLTGDAGSIALSRSADEEFLQILHVVKEPHCM